MEEWKKLLDMYSLTTYIENVAKSDVSPRLKYDLIFTNNVSSKVHEMVDLRGTYGYYDPSTTYEEDVAAFASAVAKLREDLEKILRQERGVL